MGKSERPEHAAPPEIFYNEDEARKYTNNSRMIEIQVWGPFRTLFLSEPNVSRESPEMSLPS